MNPLVPIELGIKAVSAIGSIAQGFQNNKLAQTTYDKQQEQSIRLMNLQNEYNSPTKQKERLQLAGFNPALLYRNANLQPAATYSQPAPPQRSNPFDSIMLQNLLQNLSSVQLDNEGKRLDNEGKKQDIIEKEISNSKLKLELNIQEQTLQEQIDVLKHNANTAFLNMERTAENLRHEKVINFFNESILQVDEEIKINTKDALQELGNLQVKQLKQTLTKTDAEINNLIKQGSSLDQDNKTKAIHLLFEYNTLSETYNNLKRQGKLLDNNIENQRLKNYFLPQENARAWIQTGSQVVNNAIDIFTPKKKIKAVKDVISDASNSKPKGKHNAPKGTLPKSSAQPVQQSQIIK